MARILMMSLQVSNVASKGHLNPLIGVVQWLKEQKHEVGWLPLPREFGKKDFQQVSALGVEILKTPPIREGIIMSGKEMAQTALDPAKSWRVYKSFLLDPIPEQLQKVRNIICDFNPDIVALDCMVYTGIIASFLENVPYIGICAGLKILCNTFENGYMGDMNSLIAPRQKIFSDYGMHPEFRLFECVSPSGNIVFATEALIGDIAKPPQTHLVGPTMPLYPRGDEPSFPWEWLQSQKPLVYMAFGSVHTKIDMNDIVIPVIEATASLGAQLVISSEDLVEKEFVAPEHVLIVRYAPQLKILEQAQAFVTHGGANSVMEGMYHGVPLLLVPLSGDQIWQAHFLSQTQAGISILRDKFSFTTCREALEKLLNRDDLYYRNTCEISRSYQASNGAQKAANIIGNFSC